MAVSTASVSPLEPAESNVMALNTSVPILQTVASARLINIPEIREIIMLHLDPLTMLNIISCYEAAHATFERYPMKFLNAALVTIPRIVAVSILETYHSRPRDDVIVADEVEHQRSTVDNSIGTEAELENFLRRRFLEYNDKMYPESFQHPLEALRRLAAIYVAVETLAISHIWTPVENLEMGAGTSTEHRRVSELDGVRETLWYYQLHCALFYGVANHGRREASYSSSGAQCKYLNVLKEFKDGEFMERLSSAYGDISSFLARLYQQEWGKIFERVYKHHIERSITLINGKPWTGHGWPYSGWNHAVYHREIELEQWDPERNYWSDHKVVYDTHGQFYKFIDYQMSLGLPFLAMVYCLGKDATPPRQAKSNFWTGSFFPEAYDELGIGRATLRDTCCRQAFELTPIEGGDKGYHLSITVPVSNGVCTVNVAEPIFTEPEFKPHFLGNLSEWRERDNVKDSNEAEVHNEGST